MTREINDPVEQAFVDMCTRKGILCETPNNRMDFYLPEVNLYVEVKAWPTPRLIPQLESVINHTPVMVLVSLRAVEAFEKLLDALIFKK
jgi:hypothetical protein